jgi:hypothetical protein
LDAASSFYVPGRIGFIITMPTPEVPDAPVVASSKNQRKKQNRKAAHAAQAIQSSADADVGEVEESEVDASESTSGEVVEVEGAGEAVVISEDTVPDSRKAKAAVELDPTEESATTFDLIPGMGKKVDPQEESEIGDEPVVGPKEQLLKSAHVHATQPPVEYVTEPPFAKTSAEAPSPASEDAPILQSSPLGPSGSTAEEVKHEESTSAPVLALFGGDDEDDLFAHIGQQDEPKQNAGDGDETKEDVEARDDDDRIGDQGGSELADRHPAQQPAVEDEDSLGGAQVSTATLAETVEQERQASIFGQSTEQRSESEAKPAAALFGDDDAEFPISIGQTDDADAHSAADKVDPSALFADDGEDDFFGLAQSHPSVLAESDFPPASAAIPSVSQLFADENGNESLFDDILGGPSSPGAAVQYDHQSSLPALDISPEDALSSPEGAHVPFRAALKDERDWVRDRGVDKPFLDDGMAGQGEDVVMRDDAGGAADLDIPEGWYDENGEWQWYTEEDKEQVRLAMLSQGGWEEPAEESFMQGKSCCEPTDDRRTFDCICTCCPSSVRERRSSYTSTE